MVTRVEVKKAVSTIVGKFRQSLLDFSITRWAIGVLMPQQELKLLVKAALGTHSTELLEKGSLRSYSQNYQDLILVGLITSDESRSCPLSYLEIGGGDPFFGSNSYLLQILGWHGLIFEPLPDAYEALVRERADARTQIIPKAIWVGSPSVKMTSQGLHSRVIPQNSPSGESQDSSGLLEVDAISPYELALLAMKFNLGELGVVMIDAEGSELPILSAWPWPELKPKYFLIEHNYNFLRYKKIRKLLRRQGYKEIKVTILKQDALFELI